MVENFGDYFTSGIPIVKVLYLIIKTAPNQCKIRFGAVYFYRRFSLFSFAEYYCIFLEADNPEQVLFRNEPTSF